MIDRKFNYWQIKDSEIIEVPEEQRNSSLGLRKEAELKAVRSYLGSLEVYLITKRWI